MSEPDNDESSSDSDGERRRRPNAVAATAHKATAAKPGVLTEQQRKQLLNGERKKPPSAATTTTATKKRKQPSQSPAAAAARRPAAAAAAAAAAARQGGVRAPAVVAPAPAKRQRRRASSEEDVPPRQPARRMPAAALAAAVFGEDEDNDAFQTVEVKRFVPISTVPRDVYTPEDNENERQDEKKYGGGPTWCAICNAPADAEWKEPLNKFVMHYPKYTNSVEWAKLVQDFWEDMYWTPHMVDYNNSMKPDPITGKPVDPDFVHDRFFWPLRSILHHFREVIVHPVVELADQLFEHQQLRAHHVRSGVTYQMVTLLPDGTMPPLDPTVPSQVDLRGQKSYFDSIRQIERTREQLRAELKELCAT